jgi:hypothetical protein
MYDRLDGIAAIEISIGKTGAAMALPLLSSNRAVDSIKKGNTDQKNQFPSGFVPLLFVGLLKWEGR